LLDLIQRTFVLGKEALIMCTGNYLSTIFWHASCNMLGMSWCAYIELTVSLVEAAKALSQGAENG